MDNIFELEQMMRWYGPNDPVNLSDILQAGCTGVVTALHQIPVGEVWTKEEIIFHKELIESNQLSWTVVESLPIHEEIKTQSGNFKNYIENYKESIRNLAECGIKVITYNFMPVLDWLRTNINTRLPNNAEALSFNKRDYGIFDLFILQRQNAILEYSSEAYEELKAEFEKMQFMDRRKLFNNMLQGLPGSNVPFTAGQVLSLLEKFENIDKEKLKKHLFYFLNEIAPVAEKAGIQLAIHPDDPPFSVLGLPRIMSTEQDIEDLITAVPNKANGLCFCTGSFGARPDNNIVEMIKKWSDRIYFLHLRNTTRDAYGNFMESNHLEGDTDMYAVMKELILSMNHQKRSIPMRPDHGHKMLDDLTKRTFPGYSAIGRLKGLAELRGLEYGIARTLMVEQ